MPTSAELNAAWRREFKTIQAAWFTLYGRPGSPPGDLLIHPPPGIQIFLQDVFTEIVLYVEKEVDRKTVSGELDEDTADDYAFDQMMRMLTVTAGRMYRLGQLLVTKLPYRDLAPCSCVVVTDDELENLLKTEERPPTCIAKEGETSLEDEA